ncbi:hypothetical protein B0I35DRAFT_481406 [Stachybotrys elegans]|uniref:Ankyrin repeat protein n=1 Tax=Stachybotrys elegans TaxID=80388 RepID=A0A8K0WPP2_9HYPO|nr:hypothetical protein B0I35DRAFT_481406 [Stachybotrys elegans]
MPLDIASLPAPHSRFIDHLSRNAGTQLRHLVKPYNEYEAKLRECFAQHRNHPAIQNPLVNAVPIYNGYESSLKIRARDPERDPEASKYIMPLQSDARLPNGFSAIAPSLDQFKKNFQLFCERSLDDLDWSNVVAAGSAVVTALLPVPAKYQGSKRAQREYYHEKLAPSSDVDLFIWGLDEQAAIDKIEQIERCVKNNVLAETTTIRTKNTITIVSEYPTRHVQIVLRLYKSISEILSGFDVDCSCFVFDGTQVFGSPRGITSLCAQTNTVDLTRRSPSYEKRLAKYARRGFEVYYSDLDRSRIDPSIYERSLTHTHGLARLLIIEQLPTADDREAYINQRRAERGRPPASGRRRKHALPGNVKDKDPEDVAEWAVEDDVSNYHTFTTPYGPKYNAMKIEKLLYVKDLLLNAEWNHKKDRTVNLHRHPCFIGDARSIIHDCCGSCPKPQSDEELRIAEEEAKIYVSGKLEFIKDDPGRQAIGSFNPLTADDWTNMAYLGSNQVVCDYILSGDIDGVRQWCDIPEHNVNQRDHTGRMPLHLAVMSGQCDVLKVLIESGARITSRIQGGFTSLHMAASTGRADIVRLLLETSEENKKLEAKREEERMEERASQQTGMGSAELISDPDVDKEEDSDNEGSDSATTSSDTSYVRVNKEEDDMLAADDQYGPDFFDVNVVAWDNPISPLHVAILGGHLEVVETLVLSFGADVLLPIKVKNTNNGAFLNLVLAGQLSAPDATEMVQTLVKLGANPAQSDMNQVTAAHGVVLRQNVQALRAMAETDLTSTRAGLKHMIDMGTYSISRLTSTLHTAVLAKNERLVRALLGLGAKATITYEEYREAVLRQGTKSLTPKELLTQYEVEISQPIIVAAISSLSSILLALLDAGADINTMDRDAGRALNGQWSYEPPRTVLDYVRANIDELQQSLDDQYQVCYATPNLKPNEAYLEGLVPGSYRHTMVAREVEHVRLAIIKAQKQDQEQQRTNQTGNIYQQRKKERITELKDLEQELLKRGAKTFSMLHPEAAKEAKAERSYRKPKAVETDLADYEVSVWYDDPRFNEEKGQAYNRLFQAVWDEDVNLTKLLTLRENDDGQGGSLAPLLVSTSDSWGLNVLAIAVAKNNLSLAQSILDIAAAQYKPKEDKPRKRRFRIRTLEDYEEDDNDCNPDEILLTSELVSDEFTIEDLSTLNASAASRKSPVDMLLEQVPCWAVDKPLNISVGDIHREREAEWNPWIWWPTYQTPSQAFSSAVAQLWKKHSLLGFGVRTGSMDIVKFILRAARQAKLRIHHESQNLSANDEQWVSNVRDAFDHCVSHGKWGLLELIITETGFMMPITDMLASAVVPEEQKKQSPYYQGLKIRGKRQSRWVSEANGKDADGEAKSWRKNASPFLAAVRSGSDDEIDFWKGKDCSRWYNEYGRRNQHDELVQRISKEYGSWEAAVDAWLGLRKDLAIHCAVLRGSSPNNHEGWLARVQRMVEYMPQSLDKKAGSGCSPLWLAFYYCQPETVKLLIDAGADQTTCNKKGQNILHALLLSDVPSPSDDNPDEEQRALEKMESCIKLIDPRLLASLFTGRCSIGPTGLTPLASFVFHGHHNVKILQLISRYMPDDVYTMIDGAGQTPMHQLILNKTHRGMWQMIRELASIHPRVLMQENTMGQTPYDLAWILYLQEQTNTPPRVMGSYDGPHIGVIREPSTLLQANNADWVDEDKFHIKTYRVLRELMATADITSRRHMIGVDDCREVAKRLADKSKPEEEQEWDEIKSWCTYAPRWVA